MSDEKKWWFNTKTKKVEFGFKSAALNRIGPFESQAEAENAEQIVRERTIRWEQEERLED